MLAMPAPADRSSQRVPSRAKDPLVVSASTYVADEVRADIVRGGLRLGQRIDQPGLAERYGVSIIPVREALRSLEAEGLVRMLPRHGAFVAELSPRELTEISWIRERLEHLAVQLATPRLSAAQLRGLAQLNLRLEASTFNRSAATWGRLNRRWHFTIYEAAASATLVQLITALWDRTSVYREVNATNAQRRAASVAQHSEVLRRLSARDASGAARAMRQHLRRGMRDMLATEVDLGTASAATTRTDRPPSR